MSHSDCAGYLWFAPQIHPPALCPGRLAVDASPGSLVLWLSFPLGHCLVLRRDQRVERAGRLHPSCAVVLTSQLQLGQGGLCPSGQASQADLSASTLLLPWSWRPRFGFSWLPPPRASTPWVDSFNSCAFSVVPPIKK